MIQHATPQAILRTGVRTSEMIYGQGEIYFCDNDSVVKLRDADFDVRNLKIKIIRIVLSSGSRKGSVIAVGGTTSLQEAVTALQMTLKKMQQQFIEKNTAKGAG